MSPGILTFRKSDRICSRSLTADLFNNGRTMFVHPFRVCYAPNKTACSRVLVSVPKKSFRHAVRRNHVKRLMRESLRINGFRRFSERGVDFCLVYIAKEMPDYNYLNNKIADVLAKIKKGIDTDSGVPADPSR